MILDSMKHYIKDHIISLTCFILFLIGWALYNITENYQCAINYHLALSRKNVISSPYCILTYAFVNPDLIYFLFYSLAIILLGKILEPRIGFRNMSYIIIISIFLGLIAHLILAKNSIAGILGSDIIIFGLTGALAVVLCREWRSFGLIEMIVSSILLFRVFGALVTTLCFKNDLYLYPIIACGGGVIYTIIKRGFIINKHFI